MLANRWQTSIHTLLEYYDSHFTKYGSVRTSLIRSMLTLILVSQHTGIYTLEDFHIVTAEKQIRGHV
ncbi:MAG TPA: hypothetical protein VJ697_07665 [Nitrososphaeraceae archaeon]|nr:hypothetical protein [Nitrososphaeraceae archaeon]